MSTYYRNYDSSIPTYLRNRPRDFVKHCLAKIETTKRGDITGITVRGNGEFMVESFDKQHTKYTVKFGNADLMPSCTCPAWKESAFLCKHFFLVFRKFPEIW